VPRRPLRWHLRALHADPVVQRWRGTRARGARGCRRGRGGERGHARRSPSRLRRRRGPLLSQPRLSLPPGPRSRRRLARRGPLRPARVEDPVARVGRPIGRPPGGRGRPLSRGGGGLLPRRPRCLARGDDEEGSEDGTGGARRALAGRVSFHSLRAAAPGTGRKASTGRRGRAGRAGRFAARAFPPSPVARRLSATVPPRTAHRRLVLVGPAGVPTATAAEMHPDYVKRRLNAAPWSLRSALINASRTLVEAGATPGGILRFLGPLGRKLTLGYGTRRVGAALPRDEAEAVGEYLWQITALRGSGEHALR